MNRADILATASEYVTKDRAKTHGDAESNFALIGALWSAYKQSPDWPALGERTRFDYEAYSVPMLAVFGDMLAADITALQGGEIYWQRVVPEVFVLTVPFALNGDCGTARTVVMRSVQPGTTPEVVALGTVVWLPANARV